MEFEKGCDLASFEQKNRAPSFLAIQIPKISFLPTVLIPRAV